MTNDPTDLLARYQAEQEKRRAQLPILKNALLDVLSRQGIATVTVTYDGEGDSGQIQEIHALNAADKSIDLSHDLRDQVDEFTWGVLDSYHGGFENNDGGYGELTIDVAARTVLLDHNDRIVEAYSTSTEV
jgi:hypothetical protein